MFAHVNWFDYVLVFIVVASAFIGFIRGAAREIISLLTWVVAFLAGILFSDILALALEPFIKSQTIAQLVSFILLFVVVLIIGFLINYLVGFVLGSSGHSFGSRFFGFIFGIARAGLMILFVIFIISNTKLQEYSFFTASQFSYWFQDTSVWISGRVIKEEPSSTNSATEQTQSGLEAAKEKTHAGFEAVKEKTKAGFETVKDKTKSGFESAKKAVD